MWCQTKVYKVERVQGSVLHRKAEFEKEQVRGLREKFANVVLVLNYNYPLFRHSVHYWRAIYSRVFEIMEVVSGREGDAALNVTAVRPRRKQTDSFGITSGVLRHVSHKMLP